MPQQKNAKSPDFVSVYSNNVQITSSPFDFAFYFGEVNTYELKDDLLLVDQHVRVMMSPLHAKLFAQVLNEQIRQYEEKLGQIAIPPQIVESVKKPV